MSRSLKETFHVTIGLLILLAFLTFLLVLLGPCMTGRAKGEEPAATTGKDDPGRADRDRYAKAMFALSEDPARCDCTKGRLMDWTNARAKALEEKRPVVVFSGLEPRCCGDAIPVRRPPDTSGLDPRKPIAIYAPNADGSGLVLVKELPATASPAEIKAAVAEAKKRIRP